jgi:hypothetical protein
LILMIAPLVFWIRKPKHALVWTTLPFFVFHCCIAHKEDRFLIPLLPLIIPILHLAFLKDGKIVLPDFFHKRFWSRMHRWLWRYNWLLLLLFCIYPFNVEPYIKQQKYVFEHQKSVQTYYAVNFNPYRRIELIYTFYRPADLTVVDIDNLAAMASIAKQNPAREFYFFSTMPYLEYWPDDLVKRTSLANPSYFIFKWPWFKNICSPLLKIIHVRLEDIQAPSLYKISPVD